MALELRQNLKLTQQLVMTPQLQQAIKLLQLSRIELIETINQELEANPVLEEAAEAASAKDEKSSEEANLDEWTEEQALSTLAPSSSEEEKTPWDEKALQEQEWKELWDQDNHSSLPAYSFEEKELPNYENILTQESDLTEHLLWQLRVSNLTEEDREIACLIIGNLDQNGYLKATLEEIAEETKTDLDNVERVLRQVQLFDPVGVAARDLKECLLIQIRHLGIEGSLVKILVEEYLPQLERHNYQAIVKKTGATMEEVLAAVDVIRQLDPRPGRAYSREHVQYIVPDIYVYKVDDEYVVTLNDEGMPRLRINSYYKEAVKNGMAPEDAKEFIQGKLKSAVWLIRSIHQRQRTIYKVTKSIVKFQREFLDKGVAYLKPLILRDVAEDVGMHESTISRVTTNKYVHTPQGIFELKFFFSVGLRRNDGVDVATQSVKERIKQLIQSEDPTKPYSDKQIADILAKDDIRIARRTVAKYRDLMGILPSSRRKRPVAG